MCEIPIIKQSLASFFPTSFKNCLVHAPLSAELHLSPHLFKTLSFTQPKRTCSETSSKVSSSHWIKEPFLAATSASSFPKIFACPGIQTNKWGGEICAVVAQREKCFRVWRKNKGFVLRGWYCAWMFFFLRHLFKYYHLVTQWKMQALPALLSQAVNIKW